MYACELCISLNIDIDISAARGSQYRTAFATYERTKSSYLSPLERSCERNHQYIFKHYKLQSLIYLRPDKPPYNPQLLPLPARAGLLEADLARRRAQDRNR